MYKLPKKYLSYSAIDLWLKNPAQYRKKYYENYNQPTTPEMLFGKNIALLLENADASVAHIKQYSHPEYKLDVVIEGVPFFGFIDSYDPKKKRFLEYKTGHAPWDAVRVRKHLQLPLYSLAIECLEGEVDDTCELIWMQTEKVEKKALGLVTHEDAYGIKLTGEVKSFKRKIEQWERDRLREQLVQIATDIEKDYEEYQNRPKAGGLGLR
jgi:hypothetical protein